MNADKNHTIIANVDTPDEAIKVAGQARIEIANYDHVEIWLSDEEDGRTTFDIVQIHTSEKKFVGRGPFEVGDGATACFYSDRHAGTIVEVINDKTVVWCRDEAKVIHGSRHDGSAHYAYGTGGKDAGRAITFTKRKNGAWVQKGQDMGCTPKLALGRREYYDPHF